MTLGFRWQLILNEKWNTINREWAFPVQLITLCFKKLTKTNNLLTLQDFVLLIRIQPSILLHQYRVACIMLIINPFSKETSFTLLWINCFPPAMTIANNSDSYRSFNFNDSSILFPSEEGASFYYSAELFIIRFSVPICRSHHHRDCKQHWCCN